MAAGDDCITCSCGAHSMHPAVEGMVYEYNTAYICFVLGLIAFHFSAGPPLAIPTADRQISNAKFPTHPTHPTHAHTLYPTRYPCVSALAHTTNQYPLVSLTHPNQVSAASSLSPRPHPPTLLFAALFSWLMFTCAQSIG